MVTTHHLRASGLLALLLLGLAVARAEEPVGGPGESPLAPAVGTDPGEPAAGELDVWVASTRGLPCVSRTPAHAELAIERLVEDGVGRRWERADLAALLAAPTRPLVVFVHGNRYESADARSQGISLARRLSACQSGPTPRLVILSWPSQKQGVLLRDGRRKYERAYADGQYLAWLLERVDPATPVALIGYSFGALVASEALEQLASRDATAAGGGGWVDRPGRTHVVFVAPALRADALAPRGPFRGTLAGVDRITLLINSRDEALRFFPLLEPHVKAPALGFVGMPRRWLPAEVEFAAVDAAGIVGKLHTLKLYLDSQVLARRIAAGALDGLAAE